MVSSCLLSGAGTLPSSGRVRAVRSRRTSSSSSSSRVTWRLTCQARGGGRSRPVGPSDRGGGEGTPDGAKGKNQNFQNQNQPSPPPETPTVPKAAPPPMASSDLEDSRLLRDLRARQCKIRILKTQRSRAQLGDYVSAEVTAMRVARHKLEREVFAHRRELDEALTTERYDDAASARDAIRCGEEEMRRITLAIAVEVERLTARYDAEL